jgi:hypothetical protein
MEENRNPVSDNLRTLLSFGPRAIGSAGERAAAKFIAETFRRSGLDVAREDFFASFFPLILSSKIIASLAMVILLLVGKLFYSNPLTAVMLLLILLVQVPLISWAVFGSRIMQWGRTYPTCNVVGRTPVAKGKPTVILVAHYDSKSQNLNMAWRVIFFLIPVAACGVLVVAALLKLFALAVIPSAALWSLTGLAVMCLLFQVMSRTANRSPGALDNASGVAILLSLAEQLPAKLADRANLVFLATGAEEVGLAGAIQFVRKHHAQFDPEHTLVINFDSLSGRGKVLMVGGKRLWPFDIVDIAETNFVREGFKAGHFAFLIGVGLDHIPFGRSGFNAISFIQGVGRSGWRMHSQADDLNGVDEAELARLTDVLGKIVDESCRRHETIHRNSC